MCFLKQKQKLKVEIQMKNRKQGFTLVEIMIVVMIIGLLAAIALPGFARARQTAQANACINNLRQIESAKDQLAIETGLQTGAAAPEMTALIPYLKATPVCPLAGASYVIGLIGNVRAGCSLNSATHNVNNQ